MRRFGEILPLWYAFKNIWQFFSYLAKFWTFFDHFYGIGLIFIVIEYVIKPSGHTGDVLALIISSAVPSNLPKILLKNITKFCRPTSRQKSCSLLTLGNTTLMFSYSHLGVSVTRKNCQMSIKVPRKWFHEKNNRFWHLYKNCLRIWEIWSN